MSPTLADCSDQCIILEAQSSQRCAACSLLPSGDLAYDCSNVDVEPALECPAVDETGSCTDEFVSWTCPTTLGRGFSCVSPQQNFLNASLTPVVYCQNRIFGAQSLSNCGSDICIIQRSDPPDVCNSCKLLPNGKFQYDCTNLFQAVNCSLTDAEGSCVSFPNEPEEVDVVRAATGAPTLDSNNDSNKSDAWSTSIYGLPPDVFNFISDILGLVTNILLGASVVSAYPMIIGRHLHQGHAVPMDVLGTTPSNSLHAMRMCHVMKYTLPGFSFVFFLLVADFSHAIADLDLEFVQRNRKGNDDFVLNLSTEYRNPLRPLELIGDIITARTSAEVQDAKVESILTSFLRASHLIARGGSPFVVQPGENRTKRVLGGLEGSFYEHNIGNDYISEISTEIPLNCAGTEQANQTGVGTPPFDRPIKHTINIPNCEFSALRQSGIYQPKGETARILARIAFVTSSSVGQHNTSLFLRKDGRLFKDFSLPPEDKQLARDRENWRAGRTVSSIDGVQVGNITIPFNSTVIASGRRFDTGLELKSTYEYALLGEVEGPCPAPPHASSTPTESLACLVSATLTCDEFPEDTQSIGHEIFSPTNEPSECTLRELDIVWGTGFVVDKELTMVVGSLYSVTQPTTFDLSDRTFYTNAIFAALFAMGTLASEPSNEEVVVAEFGAFYLSFMLLPLFLAMILFLLSGYQRNTDTKKIPQSSWQLMALARKDGDFLPMDGSPDHNLALRYIGADDSPDMASNELSTDRSEQPQVLRVVHDPSRNWRAAAINSQR